MAIQHLIHFLSLSNEISTWIPVQKKNNNKKTNKTFRWEIHIKWIKLDWYMCCIRHARWSPCVKINGLHMSKPVSGYITREIHFYINRVMYYGVMKCLGFCFLFFWGGLGGWGGVTILPRTTSTAVQPESTQMPGIPAKCRIQYTEPDEKGVRKILWAGTITL